MVRPTAGGSFPREEEGLEDALEDRMVKHALRALCWQIVIVLCVAAAIAVPYIWHERWVLWTTLACAVVGLPVLIHIFLRDWAKGLIASKEMNHMNDLARARAWGLKPKPVD